MITQHTEREFGSFLPPEAGSQVRGQKVMDPGQRSQVTGAQVRSVPCRDRRQPIKPTGERKKVETGVAKQSAT